MKKVRAILIASLSLFFFACENDIELAGEFQEKPVVFGLLNVRADTLYINVSKTFLQEGANAIELAQNPNNIYYDSVSVKLIKTEDNSEIVLSKLSRGKNDGVFTTEGSTIYFTTAPIEANKEYQLAVQPRNSAGATSKIVVIDTASVSNPSFGRDIGFVTRIRGIGETTFKFRVPNNIAEIKANLFFYYIESMPDGQQIERTVEIPIATVINNNVSEDGTRTTEVEAKFSGLLFFNAVADQVTNKVNRKSVASTSPNNKCFAIELIAADETYKFYQDLNGPIDGLVQVRPEFSNIENGVGLFSSRSAVTIGRYGIATETREELFQGDITGDLNFTPL